MSGVRNGRGYSRFVRPSSPFGTDLTDQGTICSISPYPFDQLERTFWKSQGQLRITQFTMPTVDLLLIGPPPLTASMMPDSETTVIVRRMHHALVLGQTSPVVKRTTAWATQHSRPTNLCSTHFGARSIRRWVSGSKNDIGLYLETGTCYLVHIRMRRGYTINRLATLQCVGT